MVRRARRLIVGGLVLALGCAAVALRRGPADDPQLRFSHAVHVGEQGIACGACHKLDAEGMTYGFGGHAECAGCHGAARAALDAGRPLDKLGGSRGRPSAGSGQGGDAANEGCKLCHASGTLDPAALDATRWHFDIFHGEVRFSHASHAAFDCARCHASVSASSERGPRNIPKMENCLGCHSAEPVSTGPPSGCGACHMTMRPDFMPESHHGLFEKRHGRLAREPEATCARCHRASACEECHRTRRPDDHSPRFERAAHGLAATRDRERCSTCHEADQCAACHARPPANHSIAFMMRVPPATADPQVHAREARRRTNSCTVCHTFAETCSKCH